MQTSVFNLLGLVQMNTRKVLIGTNNNYWTFKVTGFLGP